MKNIFMLFLLMILNTSCDDFLDVKPKGKLIPNAVEDYDNLLNYEGIVKKCFSDNNKGSLLPYLTDDIKLSKALEDLYLSHPNIDRYNAYIFKKPYKNPELPDNIWVNSYRNMAYLNVIIRDVKAAVKTKADEKLAEIVKAQALIARAWQYFTLAQVYGPIYNPNGDNEVKVIPLVTDPEIGSKIPDLATSKEVLEFVFKDIYKALPTLPENVKHPSRANKKAAYALLANIHMFTNKWDSVEYYSEKAWDGEGKLYDYNDFILEKPDDPESVKVLGIERKPNNKENLFYRFSARSIGSQESYVSDELVNSFIINDLRFKLFYRKIKGKNDDDEFQQQFNYNAYYKTTGYSYPEVLLMRAEAYARNNKLQKAINDLNILRKYRYETGTEPLELSNLSQDEVIMQVLSERRKELAFITLKRFLDLKRFSLESGKPWYKNKVIHFIEDTQYEGEISEKFHLVIPKLIKEYNEHWIE
ncbi:MAG: RagB/SusD family nutrient uptake outer membrane protein [Marinifilum sp.]|jgi:hypothetical protein|nr:RagB/SusD family nutrient uptake outer membrane protein [Marinifilum sp.]